MRDKIEYSIINLLHSIENKGLFKTIQYILYGNNTNVCPKVCKW